MRSQRLLAACLLPAFALAPLAQDEESASPAQDDIAITHHSVGEGAGELAYTAHAGRMQLSTEDGDARAHIFHVAYLLDGVEDQAERPVTFCYNGGPGSSSVWLHMGTFGPRRVLMDPEGRPLPPPAEVVANEFGLLAFTDLVFIDPPSTGYSRAAEDVSPSNFHGLYEDVEVVSEFIRLWLVRNGRWDSPKFLAGESYGTTRSAELSGRLQQHHGIYLNGIVLVSAILNFQTARFDTGNDLPYPLFLPTYAATAWFHGQLDAERFPELRPLLDEVEAFAVGEYASALMLGDGLGEAERDAVVRKLADYTGLSQDYVRSCNLRPVIGRFVKELRREERLTVGRLDSRFVGRDLDSSRERYEFDPSMAAIQGPYTAGMNDYVRNELGYESDLPYEILTGRVHPWSYERHQNRYVNVAETLRGAMTRNAALHVFVANGYYDLATPYFATEYTFGHMGLDEEMHGRVSMGWYESGHMMYIREADLVQLHDDLARFYANALDR